MHSADGTRIIATKNRNRNMVYAMLQRVPDKHDPCFADGLQEFGVAMLIGIHNRVKLLAMDFPYEKLSRGVANHNRLT